MTTCRDCGFNHILNIFIVEFTEDDSPILECPHCGSDDCVKDAFASEEGYETNPLGNSFEAVKEFTKADSDPSE